jgi:hypothetical protein
MTPEQIALIAALFGLAGITIAAAGKLVNWFPEYVQKVATQKIEEKAQELTLEKLDTETELLERKNEAEAKRRSDIALSETVERVLVMFSQTQDRHAKMDERHAENAEKKVESDKQLATAIENLTRSAMTSQLWQENRANDFLDTANLINEKMGALERVGKTAIDALDRLEIGLNEARVKLNLAIESHTSAAQQSTLLAIQTQLTSLAIMVESLSPKAPLILAPESPAPVKENLIDTRELTEEDMLAATRVFPDESETENPTKLSNEPDSQPNLPKASGL